MTKMDKNKSMKFFFIIFTFFVAYFVYDVYEEPYDRISEDRDAGSKLIELKENWYYWEKERSYGGVRDVYWYLKKIIPYSLLEKLVQGSSGK